MSMPTKEAAAILIRQAAAMVDGALALLQSEPLYGADDRYDYEAGQAIDLLGCASQDLERAEEACK